MSSLAGTATNYSCLSEIEDTANFLADYIHDLSSKRAKEAEDKTGKLYINRAGEFFHYVRQRKNATNTSRLVDSAIET
jgi:hypothetical protein